MGNLDAEAFLPLHDLEFRILLAVGSESRHGYSIVKEVELSAPHSARIFPANLYRRIRDLLKKGLIEEEAAPGHSTDSRRRYFVVTALGRATARAEAARLRALLSDAEESSLLVERDA